MNFQILKDCYSPAEIEAKIRHLAQERHNPLYVKYIMGEAPHWQRVCPSLDDSIAYYVKAAKKQLEEACVWNREKDQNELIQNMSQLTILNSVYKDY